MAEKAENHEERKRDIAPWVWSLIWSILGVLLALLIIFLMTWPFWWQFGWFTPAGDSAEVAALNATQTAVAGTATAEALRGPDTPAADAGDVQNGGASQTATAQTSAAQTSPVQTETAEADEAGATGTGATASNATSESEATTATPTVVPPTPTPNPAQAVATAGEVDVYLGPGLDYPIVATLPAEVPLPVIGQNEAGDWWQVAGPDGSSGWVPADQVTASNIEGVPLTTGPQAVADGETDLYLGPGTSYPIVATVPADTPLPVIGQNEDGSWWQVIDPDGTIGWLPNAAVAATNTTGVPPAQGPQLSATGEEDLYLGPGAVYPIIGSLPANTPLPLTGQNADDNWWQALDPDEAGDWWQVVGPEGGSGWVPADPVTVENVAGVPVAQGPQLTATDEEDLYLGPGIDYPIIATFPPDFPLPIVGRNQDSTWWQVVGPDETLGWVPDLLASAVNTEQVPEVEAPPLPEPAAEPSEFGTTRGGDYIVQRDDWLSKLSDKFYSSPIAYWPIIAATNLANAENPDDYARITDADFIEIGDRLRIPSSAEAEAFLQDFDPAEDSASIGLTVIRDLSVTSNITPTASLTLTNELTETLDITVTLDLTDTTALTETNESN